MGHSPWGMVSTLVFHRWTILGEWPLVPLYIHHNFDRFLEESWRVTWHILSSATSVGTRIQSISNRSLYIQLCFNLQEPKKGQNLRTEEWTLPKLWPKSVVGSWICSSSITKDMDIYIYICIYIYISNYIPMDPNTSWEGTDKPPVMIP